MLKLYIVFTFLWWLVKSHCQNLNTFLKYFEFASGLNVNISQSKLIGIGVSPNEVASMASPLGCSHEFLPFIFSVFQWGKEWGFVMDGMILLVFFMTSCPLGKPSRFLLGVGSPLSNPFLGASPFIIFLCLELRPKSLILWNLFEVGFFGLQGISTGYRLGEIEPNYSLLD